MLVRLIHWMNGWVTFSLVGADCGRVLTNIRNQIFSAEKKNGEVIASCLRKDYLKIARTARKYHCRTQVKERGGLPILIKKYQLRFGLLIGFVFMVLALWLSSFFVWEVDVNGNFATSDDQILEVAAAQGLKPGGWIPDLDISSIEFEIKQNFPEIAWIAVNRNATHFTIEISEVTPQPEKIDRSQPCNIAAAYDGVILSIEPYSGFPLVKAGDVVCKDQLLVSGIEEEENGQVLYAHAWAKVVAEVERTFDYVRPLYTTRISKTGETVDKKVLSIFGLKIPLGFQKPPSDRYIKSTTEEQVVIFGVQTPFSIETTHYELLEETEVNNDPDELKRLLMDDAKQGEEEALAGDKILSRQYVYETTEDSMILHCTDLVEQEIQEERPITITNTNPSE